MKQIKIKNQNHEKLKLQILDHIAKDILNYGFRNFTLDEVASNLHISKKMIYQVFQTKEELIRAVIIAQLGSPYNSIHKIFKEESSTVEKLINLSIVVEQYYSAFNPTSIKRLAHYFPELADYVEQFRNNRIIPLINQLLKDGKKKNLILDIPDQIIIEVFTSALGTIAESKSDNSTQYSYRQKFRQAFDILLNGILTNEGKQLLNYKLEVIK
ncbi:MAG: TetR/AcrR family transcriptional regulator [Ignavibacteriaceae bacterium]|nr:TetR/AcrR family transcriptional regulator [Ignavibacterium sp.]MCC6253471.1 TetR/AcrR family transcriptional regulator [Ignavibacteriaceae bacterium]HRN26747.1 TetR/AcrR family transcriptional regulator [Ignavibacteriaceae bacterium]HRP92666.1 TetR/AcrR family transcriptional regulator [Ignavibacteriaceae bacterium]HRQ54815.1 TetR/AcrR family transcriptional regulator [Ignavibacteriaceae bacterium]